MWLSLSPAPVLTSRNVTFLPSQTGAGPGFQLNYQSLTLHALTPASASGDMEAHLYCQIDDSPSNSGVGGDEDEDEFGEMRELRVFVQEGKRQYLSHPKAPMVMFVKLIWISITTF